MRRSGRLIEFVVKSLEACSRLSGGFDTVSSQFPFQPSESTSGRPATGSRVLASLRQRRLTDSSLAALQGSAATFNGCAGERDRERQSLPPRERQSGRKPISSD